MHLDTKGQHVGTSNSVGQNNASLGQCPFDPNFAQGSRAETILRAANGDMAAQRKMRDMFFDEAAAVPPDTPNALLFGLEMIPYARLCAARGNAEDARCLAGALCYTFEASRHAGFGNRGDIIAGEAVSILERLAEEGDEEASAASLEIATIYPPAGAIALRLMKGSK